MDGQNLRFSFKNFEVHPKATVMYQIPPDIPYSLQNIPFRL